MCESDLDEVVRLERNLFSDPWPAELFLQDIRGGESGFTVVGEWGGAIVCYGVSWQVRTEFHIANMAVRRESQNEGIGGWLLDEMLAEARNRRCRLATLEVRLSNERAIALYRSRNFREVAIRTGYYTDNGEDALVMLRDIESGDGENGGLVS